MSVEVTGPWYANYGYQFALKLEKQLKQTCRFVVLHITGIAALVSLIATATVSSLALSQSAHTAEHVNILSRNISHAFSTQETIDRKILSRLDGLEEAVEYLGNQLSLFLTQMSLIYHGGYQHICVMPLPTYNHSWENVQRHLRSFWHHTNLTLDLDELQSQINTMRQSHLDITDPSNIAGQFLRTLRGFNPGNIL